jgi:predicted PurR-regulated permease PerM
VNREPGSPALPSSACAPGLTEEEGTNGQRFSTKRKSAISRTGHAASRSPLGGWPNDRLLSFIVLLAVTAASLYLAYIIFRPFLASLFLSFVLAVAFSPLHHWVSRHVRSNSVAAGLTTAVVVLFVLVPSILLSQKLLAEATSLYGLVSQQWSSSGTLRRLSGSLFRMAEDVGISQERLSSEIATRAQELGSWAVGMAGWAARGVAQQGVTSVLIFFILFFFLRDRENFRAGVSDLLPLPPGRFEELAAIVHKSIVNNVYGMFAVSVTQGILTGLGSWVARLPAPLLWGVLAMIFSFVPMVGPSWVWFPGVVVLALTGDWGKAIFLFLWGAVLVTGADYLIRPKFAGAGKDVSTLLVLLSFFGGVSAFGIIGIFVGPVMLSLITALLRMVREERLAGIVAPGGTESRRGA